MDDINADEAQRIATDMGFPHALEDPLVLNDGGGDSKTGRTKA